jgi:hypothetical protein
VTFPFGTVIRYDTEAGLLVLLVIGPNIGVCLTDLPWRYAGEVTEFAGDDWEVLDGPD